jgi:hypothetical protein
MEKLTKRKMATSDVLAKIKSLVGIDEKFEKAELKAEAFLVDGTRVMTDADRFEEGTKVFILSDEDEQLPLPTGSYEMQDGGVIEVTDGEIVTLKTPEGEDKVEEEMAKEEVKEEVDLSSFASKEELFESCKLVSEAVTENVTNAVMEKVTEMMKEFKEESTKELSKVKNLSAEKSFKHTMSATDVVANKKAMAEMTPQERVKAIFNKVKNK